MLFIPLGLAALAWLATEIGAGDPAFALCVALVSLGSAPFVGDALARALPHRWSAVPDRALTVFHRLGAGWFNRFLSLIGWNALILRMRQPLQSPSDAVDYARSLRASAAGHSWGLILHLVFAVTALVTAGVPAALLILVPGLLLHAYPVILQLIGLHRLEPILAARR
ncbi:hypothetical protein [Citricoccus nitrophenolicus]|uniref:hypothetical protein n=1 Tax=Citricoccus nitrophenolicus TaxID=863575 RepID=UPI0031E9A2B2